MITKEESDQNSLTIYNAIQSDSAKKAFNKLNDLQPNDWVASKGKNRVYLSANFATKKIGSSVLDYSIGGYSETFDKAAETQLQDIKEKLQAPDTILVVNAGKESRFEYTYNKKTNSFAPYKHKADTIKITTLTV